jgi:hypothetical protein
MLLEVIAKSVSFSVFAPFFSKFFVAFVNILIKEFEIIIKIHSFIYNYLIPVPTVMIKHNLRTLMLQK